MPKSRGVRAGTVAAVTRRGVRVELAEVGLLAPGDGVVFDLGRPAGREPGGRVWQVRPSGARAAELTFGDDLDLSEVEPGCVVWKTDDPALKRRLEATYVDDPIHRRTPVAATLTGRAGGALTLYLTPRPPLLRGEGGQPGSVALPIGETRGGRSLPPLVAGEESREGKVSATWPGPLELAEKHPPTVEAIRDQLDRLGDTPFELADVRLDLADPVLVPRSVLNDLRRRAVADLLARRRVADTIAVRDADALPRLRAERPTGTDPLPPGLAVLVRTAEQLDAVLAWRPALVYCDFEDGRRYGGAVAKARAAGVPVGLATLRVLKPGEDGFLNPVLAAEPDAVLVRNLGAIDIVREKAPGLPLVGDYALNVANDLSAALLFAEGLGRLVPSYDLNWDQFAALAARTDAGRLEAVIHQHMPMFHTEHCVFAAALSSGKDFRDCGRPCDRHRVELRDRVGAAFPVVADAGCRNTVYNAVPQSAAEYVGRMKSLGIRSFRVELLRETAAEVGPLLDEYARVIAERDDGGSTWRRLRALNQLGVTRGTLQMA